MIGSPRSARYVGYALRANPEPGADAGCIPCHRVVFKDGGLCKGFVFGGPDEQRAMLEEEGVAFADATHVDLEACLWDGRCGDGTEGGPDGGAGGAEGEPLAPPPDFDWKRELGED